MVLFFDYLCDESNKMEFMKLFIEEKDAQDVQDKLTELDNLLTERIADLHGEKGMMQCRHVYIFYRKLVWEIERKLSNSLKTDKK